MTSPRVDYQINPRFVPDDVPIWLGNNKDSALIFDNTNDEWTVQTRNAAGTLTDRLRIKANTDTPSPDLVSNPLKWTAGRAVTAAEYSIGRDLDATNQLHLNVPTGATFELSVNDTPEFVFSATQLDLSGNNLVNVGSQTITGATGNTLVVDTNVLVVDATNNRVGVGTATPTTNIEVSGGGPRTRLRNTNGALNEKIWDWATFTTTFTGTVVNDADNTEANWIVVTRSGFTVSSVAFPAARHDINGVTYSWPSPGGSIGQQLQTDGATPQVLSWAAAGSLREMKDILALNQNHEDAFARIVATPVYDFHYKPGFGTGDHKTRYTGILADEAPWAMHFNNSVVNPVNTLGYMVLGFKAVDHRLFSQQDRLNQLEPYVQRLEHALLAAGIPIPTLKEQ